MINTKICKERYRIYIIETVKIVFWFILGTFCFDFYALTLFNELSPAIYGQIGIWILIKSGVLVYLYLIYVILQEFNDCYHSYKQKIKN